MLTKRAKHLLKYAAFVFVLLVSLPGHGHTADNAEAVARRLFDALVAKDVKAMEAVVADNAHFQDNVYPDVNGRDVLAMYHMISHAKDMNLSYRIHRVEGNVVHATWEGRYTLFGRPIHNIIHSTITVRDGQVVDHKDHFDMDRWGKQALGWGFYPLRYTWTLQPIMRFVGGIGFNNFKKENGYTKPKPAPRGGGQKGIIPHLHQATKS